MFICTTNMGKVREFASLLSPLGIDLKPITHHHVPELGCTFIENGRMKAQAYANLYPNRWILAEDSGLVVPALNGMPGHLSARYDDVQDDGKIVESLRDRLTIDFANNMKVLDKMKNVSPEHRGAYFVSHLVVINPHGQIAFETERRAVGWIATEMKGSQGFGYDPIFQSDTSYGKTWAEIDSVRKNLISHRSEVIWDFLAWVCSTTEEIT